MGCSGSKLGAVSTGLDGRLKSEAEEILSHSVTIQQNVPELRTLLDLHPNPTQLIELKMSVSSNLNLLRYIDAYITNAAATIKFLTNILQCIEAARKASSCLHASACFFTTNDYHKTLSMMKEFANVGKPFAALLVPDHSLALVEQHNEAAGAMDAWRKKLERKLRKVKVPRQVFEAACKTAFVLALASAVVLAALGMPPLATTSAFAGSSIIKFAEELLDKILKGREKKLEREREVVRAMGAHWFVVHELETIRLVVGNVEIELGSLVNQVELVVREADNETTVIFAGNIGFKDKLINRRIMMNDAMNVIKDRLKVLDDRINGLGIVIDRCINDIKDVVANFFKLVIEGV